MSRNALAVTLVAAVALLVIWLWVSRKRKSPAPSNAEIGLSTKLRDMALRASASEVGIPIPHVGKGVWGTVADISLAGGSATVVAFADGTASIYTGSAGGVIGGQGNASVRRAAEAAVGAMERCADQMKASGIHPLPKPGYVRLYVHSRSGLLSSEELLQDTLAAGRHPMAPCFSAINDVITELRLASEAGV